jgi:hypothetical protein
MQKELKKAIYEHVSTLRNLFVKMLETLKEGIKQKEQADGEIQAMKAVIDACRRANNNPNREKARHTLGEGKGTTKKD